MELTIIIQMERTSGGLQSHPLLKAGRLWSQTQFHGWIGLLGALPSWLLINCFDLFWYFSRPIPQLLQAHPKISPLSWGFSFSLIPKCNFPPWQLVCCHSSFCPTPRGAWLSFLYNQLLRSWSERKADPWVLEVLWLSWDFLLSWTFSLQESWWDGALDDQI